MEGDKLIIHEGHRKAAHQLIVLLVPQIAKVSDKFIITIAGESGSGKSEIAAVLIDLLSEKNLTSVIIQQDDYFVYPPKTNAKMRRKDINHVGPSEVHIDLLDRNLKDILNRKNEIIKPLVIFDEDKITEEMMSLEGINVVIVEGTYTTMLKNVHKHIFIERTYIDTKESREQRAREEQDEYLEKILEIEHNIISKQKSKADIIVMNNYEINDPALKGEAF